jgi:protein-tyrosine phosphatase
VSGVDLHSHVLPGVDDGAPDLETSLAMLRLAREGGTSDIVATSHQHPGRYPNEPEILRTAFENLSRAAKAAVAAGEDLPRLHLGAEVHLDGDLLELLRRGRRLRLAGGPWVLLELPDVFPQAPVEQLVFRMQADGLWPLLAHPERIGQFLRQPEQLLRLVEMGALGQATGSSLCGDFGPPCRDVTVSWLRQGLLHLVASDAHDLRRRTPDLARARAAAREIFGAASERRWFEERPRAVLEGKPLEVDPPRPPERARRGILGRLLRDRD